MRKLVLTVVMACLVTVPVVGQFFPGMLGGGLDGSMLVNMPNVQKALKLSDDQKDEIKKASTTFFEDAKKAREDNDTDGVKKARETYSKAIQKSLKDEQKTRLLGIEAQMAERMGNLNIFNNEAVQKALKLTDKQKETAKTAAADLQKDLAELRKDAGTDKEKLFAAFKKMATMGKEAFEKVSKTLTEEQKKAWKELKGEEVELGFGGFRPKKKDD